ncbi:unnamed protein product [Staurois parvus]|uniref:Uncharacterized protein n=1 Tax=Staurois parvus TaxID=386267 RepID=A0ABN9D8F1_9NEOB|nr:unnamed protein product [Staurois parvus]
MYIHRNTHAQTCTYTQTHVHTDTCTYIHTMYTHTYLYIHAEICTDTHMYIHIDTCTCIHRHTQKLTHMYTHTHPYKKLQYFVVHSQSRVLHSKGRQRAQHTPSFAFTALSY